MTIRAILDSHRGNARPHPAAAEGAVRAWPLALARAAHDRIGLALAVTTMHDARHSLAELLDQVEDRALLVVLEGPAEGLGLLALSPEVLSALVEMQTIGRLGAQAPAIRKPTRTDVAMALVWIEAALSDFETGLRDDPDLVWAGGFRYASFLDDPRPLGLLLEDQAYRVLRADLDLAEGARAGRVLLALPAVGRGERPATAPAAETVARDDIAWERDLAAAVLGAGVALDATLARLTLPLGQLVGLRVDDVIPLGTAALERVSLGTRGSEDASVAEGRLGQHRGMRALRLSSLASEVPAPPAVAEPAAPPPPARSRQEVFR